MKMKSVMAGEYTAPPAHAPMTNDSCGTTPEASTLRWKTSAYPARESTPSWMRAPPESLSPITGHPSYMDGCGGKGEWVSLREVLGGRFSFVSFATVDTCRAWCTFRGVRVRLRNTPYA